jgi:hypothetical protein
MQLFLYLGNFKLYVIILKYFLNDDKLIFQFCQKYYVIYLFSFEYIKILNQFLIYLITFQ